MNIQNTSVNAGYGNFDVGVFEDGNGNLVAHVNVFDNRQSFTFNGKYPDTLKLAASLASNMAYLYICDTCSNTILKEYMVALLEDMKPLPIPAHHLRYTVCSSEEFGEGWDHVFMVDSTVSEYCSQAWTVLNDDGHPIKKWVLFEPVNDESSHTEAIIARFLSGG